MIKVIKEYSKKDVDSILLTINNPFIKSICYIIIPKENIDELYELLEEYGDIIVGGKILDVTEFIK